MFIEGRVAIFFISIKDEKFKWKIYSHIIQARFAGSFQWENWIKETDRSVEERNFSVQRGEKKSVFEILNIQYMRPNVACSDGEIDFPGQNILFFIDSMRPYKRFSQLCEVYLLSELVGN